MYLFVYGTLRQGTATPMHRMLARHSEFCGLGYLQARLYQVGDYPGLVLSDAASDKVVGEIYRLRSTHTLGLMDEYEECTDEHPRPHEYVRQLCFIDSEQLGVVEANVYLYNFSTERLALIPSGDFLKF